MVYDYFDLPPALESSEYTGFALSCRQAKDEMEHAATKRMARVLKEFEASFELGTKITVTVPDLPSDGFFTGIRNITLTVPFAVNNYKRYR
jgi:hypothetical protein